MNEKKTKTVNKNRMIEDDKRFYQSILSKKLAYFMTESNNFPTENKRTADKFLEENHEFFQGLSRKILLNLGDVDLIDESIKTQNLSILTEAIEKSELTKLEDMAKEAAKDIDETIADATELEFKNTTAYLEKLKGELPGTFGLVKLAFGGDPKKAAEQIGQVTSVTSKLNLARDSFNDAVTLFGTELAKLPFSQETVWKKFEEEQVDEEGKVKAPAAEGAPLGEFKSQFKEAPIIDLIKMAEENPEGLEVLEFPDEQLLRKAAENSYKPPPEPEGMWGKLMSFFGGGDLTAAQFADDVLGAPLSKLVAKAEELAQKAKDAETDAKESEEAMKEIGDDLQQLATGDSSAVAGAATGGKDGKDGKDAAAGGAASASAAAGSAQTPAAQGGATDTIQPGAGPDGKDLATYIDLKDRSTAPVHPDLDDEDFAKVLGDLINSDPKSRVQFVDELPDAEDAKKEDAPKAESWVHTRSLSDLLFEDASEPLQEAIFFKDIQQQIIDSGIPAEDLFDVAHELADRLQNDFDVEVKGLPSEKAAETAEKIVEEVPDPLIALMNRNMDIVEKMIDKIGMSDKDRQLIALALEAGAKGNAEETGKLISMTDCAEEGGGKIEQCFDGVIEEIVETKTVEVVEEFEEFSEEEVKAISAYAQKKDIQVEITEKALKRYEAAKAAFAEKDEEWDMEEPPKSPTFAERELWMKKLKRRENKLSGNKPKKRANKKSKSKEAASGSESESSSSSSEESSKKSGSRRKKTTTTTTTTREKRRKSNESFARGNNMPTLTEMLLSNERTDEEEFDLTQELRRLNWAKTLGLPDEDLHTPGQVILEDHSANPVYSEDSLVFNRWERIAGLGDDKDE